jgi:2-iminobutanoate/2-iminopropanoate deaminase
MRSIPIATALKHNVRRVRRTTVVAAFTVMLASANQVPLAADLVPAVVNKKVIGTPPGRPYSPGIQVGDTLYVSGQVGFDPNTEKLPEDFAAEVTLCLENVRTVLRGGGLDFSDVVSVQIYLTDLKQFDAMNSLYAAAFKKPYPTRTTVGVAALPLGAHIEITVTARSPAARGS